MSKTTEANDKNFCKLKNGKEIILVSSLPPVLT